MNKHVVMEQCLRTWISKRQDKQRLFYIRNSLRGMEKVGEKREDRRERKEMEGRVTS